MKINPIFLFLFTSMVACVSCSKDPVPPVPKPARTLRFILYTDKDFSTNNNNISFSLFIRTHSTTLFDSALATMKIKDIPRLANKIVIEKQVPNDNGSDLAAGFNYTIENVGQSWYTDTIAAGVASKEIVFAFQ
jgi:hypothetical protein